MPIPGSDRRYFESWLRRTGRRLAASGSLSQTALLLSQEQGGTADEWRTKLRNILEGDEQPSLDLLTRIDAILARPTPRDSGDSSQPTLFE
ncbi:MAG: hypothetical protein ACQCXQ_02200 [Verrucomicrobiales bacterium]|nr:hypothetical protein [Verrucomicrobiota bacterium JB025]